MVSLSYDQTRRSGVTLVEVVVRNDGPDARHVELRHELDGPLWPPRRNGVPEAGWSDAGYEGVFPPGETALGYSTPAPPDEPPVAVAAVGPPVGDERDRTVADVVREYGDASPPPDAVPGGDERAATVGSTAAQPAAEVPPPVSEWLAAHERRVERARALAEADDLDELTAALEDVGGLASAERLATALAADREALAGLPDATVHQRPSVPLVTLEALS